MNQPKILYSFSRIEPNNQLIINIFFSPLPKFCILEMCQVEAAIREVEAAGQMLRDAAAVVI